MEPDDVRSLYDHAHAHAYDERFLRGEDWSRQGSDYELELIGGLLDRAVRVPRWLDVACGTGWYLGRFPDVDRVGIDLSPAMAEAARRNAPGADIRVASFLDPHPDWEDAFSLVSCMWAAYSYVSSLAELDRLLENLAAWTSPDGSCFLPVCDIEDLAGGLQVPYRNDDTWVFGGTLLIKSVIWDWKDDRLDRHHRDLVAPHVDHLVELFGQRFGMVEVVRYPPYLPGWGTRKAIVASRKHGPGAQRPSTVVRHPAPPWRAVGSDDVESPDIQRGKISVAGGLRRAARRSALRAVNAARAWLGGDDQ